MTHKCNASVSFVYLFLTVTIQAKSPSGTRCKAPILWQETASSQGVWGAGSAHCHFSRLYPGPPGKPLPRLASASPPAARDAVASSEPFQLPRPALATPATGLVAPGQALPAGLHCSGAELSRGSGDLRPHTPSTDTLTDTHSRPARGGRDPRKWIPAWRAPGRGGVDCCQPGPGRRHRCHARLAPAAGRLVAERPLQSLRSLSEVWWKPRIKNKGKPTLFASFASQC